MQVLTAGAAVAWDQLAFTYDLITSLALVKQDWTLLKTADLQLC